MGAASNQFGLGKIDGRKDVSFDESRDEAPEHMPPRKIIKGKGQPSGFMLSADGEDDAADHKSSQSIQNKNGLPSNDNMHNDSFGSPTRNI